MLDVFQEIDSLDEHIQDNLRTYTRLLLHRQHLLERQDKGAFQFITSEKYRNLFNKIMDACGYNLIIMGERTIGNGLVGIVPMESLSFYHVKKVPIALVRILFCLYKIYHEKANKNEFDDKLRVGSNIDEICIILNKEHNVSEYKSVIPLLREAQSMGVIEELYQEEKDSLMRTFLINQSIDFYITNEFKMRWDNSKKQE